MKKRIEVEEAENGYTVRVYGHQEVEKDEEGYEMYPEPKTLVATDEEEVSTIFKKFLTKKKDD